jgi:hypothetical protein
VTLTTALAILGAVVLMAVLLHGWWNTRRASPRPAATATHSGAVDGERVEPGMDTPNGESALAAPPRIVKRATPIDALIDAIATLELEAPISGEVVLANMPSTRRVGSKPLFIEGLDADSGEWTPASPDKKYSELQAAVQLANRSGALNEIEYSEFVQKVQALADAVGASVDFPDMLEVVARARELDGLTGPLDAQLTLSLRSNSVAWSAGYIQQVASRHGFVPGVLPGRLVVPSPEEGAPPVLVLSFDAQAALAEDPQQAPVRECHLMLDVPQIEERLEPFPAWHNAARSLADDMDALLMDDQGQTITLHAFAAIGTELQALYRRLEALDLAAGSAVARRLFS